VATAQRILRSFGYFEGSMAFNVADLPQPEAPGGTPPADPPRPRALVTVTVEPGRPFLLARHGFVVVEDGGAPPALPDALALGSPIGQPAAAQAILDAEAAAVAALRHDGRPYAERLGRDAVADMERAELEVDTTLRAGRAFVFGEPRFEGLRRVEERYLRTYLNWEPGAPVDTRLLAAYQRDLVDTDLFDTVTVRVPEEPPEGEVAPVIVSVEEGKRRTVTAGLRFSSDRGLAARGSFEHRNMFGANETGGIEAFAGLDEQRLEARYRIPQFLRHEQAFTAGAGFRNLELDAFSETAFTVTAGIERRIHRRWVVGAGGLAELTETKDSFGETTFLLFGLPFFANYDGTEDFLNPTQGSRLRADATPFVGIADDDSTPFFVRLDLLGSRYFALDDAADYVFAVRGRAGSILAGAIGDVPASRRLYSGGGGSVRGFADRSLGPLDSNNDPTGGLSVAEVGAEMRARVWGDVGGVVFAEAGAVGEEAYFDLSEPLYAAGAGVRYFSPVGPIRLDVGVPLNPRDSDDNFQIYLSIGQAF
jgi:translocation and assembly module TamA